MRSITALLLLAAPLAAAPPDPAALLARIRAETGVPALAGAVSRGTEPIRAAAVGTRARGTGKPVTAGDRFHFGSNGKSMTATLVARLVEKKKLRWQATLAEVFPELGERLHPSYRAVTLEQLLSHSGGAPRDLKSFLGKTWVGFFTSDDSPAEQRSVLATAVLTRPAEHPAGTKWSYSNAGTTLAGIAAERAGGRSYEELLADEVWAPLGMESCGFGPPASPGELDQPWGHIPHPRTGELIPVPPEVVGADNPKAVAPAGTVACSPEDWARYLRAHAGGGPPGYLTRESWQALHRPRIDAAGGMRYALGWLVGPAPGGGTWLMHDGSNQSWYAYTAVIPEESLAVLGVANQGGTMGSQAAVGAMRKLLAGYRPSRVEKSRAP